MRLMWRYTKRYKGLLALNFIFVFGFILIELGLPTLLGQLIDHGVAPKNPAEVYHFGLWMVLINLIGLVGLIGLAYTGSKLSTNIIRDMRDDIFEQVTHFSHETYGEFGVSSLITRTTNDAFQVMTFLQMVFRTGFMTPLMFIASGVMIVRTARDLAGVVFLAVPVLLIGVAVIGYFSEPMSTRQQKNLDWVNLTLREMLSGIRVIRAFVREKFFGDHFEDANRAYTKSSISLYTLMALAQPGFSFIFNIVFVIILWLGALQINAGQMEIGALIAFIEYIFHVLFSFMLFASVFMMYPRAAVSAKRIDALLQVKNTVTENPNGITTTTTHGELEFDQVTFAYPGHSESPILRDVSFTAHAGQTVAFVGSTGSGKSTLIQLIPRFFDVNEGTILVDGHPVYDYNLKALRAKIGYIPQKAVLFSGSIRENLQYGDKTASDESLWEALRIAEAADFVRELPEQLDTVLSEGGSNLSGGQKQRLAIARALVRKPEIYIFDDSFSALDYATDARLRQNLAATTSDKLVLIVAQRVGTIMHADTIVVLDEGHVVATGTHKELLKTSPIYAAIAASQLSEEELAQ
ncbi:ABC transporter ATP-binding protein [Lacticaseibacillus saniviri]|uniref:ABC transporter ATP-binding protein n=1 Tax=Lacticaseibacillus saniviri TaxID=931533 RepID=UPI001EDFB5AE|nr:ABC transporter ATP-binding protein [Lacticaseibacillus saniviri]MCG4282974.1 ABC transporter ATP-binding protein/permease [Lacticaseibacillus saniviri]